MQAVTTIGLDIAKSVFQVHGIDAEGNLLIRRQLNRRSANIAWSHDSLVIAAFFGRPVYALCTEPGRFELLGIVGSFFVLEFNRNPKGVQRKTRFALKEQG
jgi:hypothetical protein